ncbi:sensor histidine kinase [Amycolatopsis samaneae]|uniref:histidine kinase n=1 Tax=Amycolatopsis samaneae TaxID=664691 RepID=A0ABW5GRC1_9PSEU
MRRRPARTADAAMVRRASLRVGLQTAGAVALTVIALVGVAVLVVLRDQHQSQNELLSATIARADDVDDPPAGVWLVLQNIRGRQATAGLPAGFPQEDDLRAASAGEVRSREVTTERVEYEVRTEPHDGGVVQAILSLRTAHRERDRLVRILLGCGVAGLLLAAVAGAWLGRRAVIPLARSLSLQRRFVADAGHELRTPLTLLSTRAQLIRRELDRDDGRATVRSEVDGLVTDADRLAAILDDLLIAADPRGGSARGPVRFADLVGQEVEAARPLADQRGIRLRLEREPGDPVVDGFDAGLRRAVGALLDNAIRHAAGEVVATETTQGNRIVLTVADDGPGIDPAVLPRLFERFVSGERRHTGTGPRRYGLGLALVAEVVARHGGTVSAHNENDGAVFRVTLPRG